MKAEVVVVALKNKHHNLAGVSDIFDISSVSEVGRGRRSPRRKGGGGFQRKGGRVLHMGAGSGFFFRPEMSTSHLIVATSGFICCYYGIFFIHTSSAGEVLPSCSSAPAVHTIQSAWSGAKKPHEEEAFGTDIPWTSRGHLCRCPRPKLWSGPSKPCDNKHVGATSMTRRRTSTTPRDFQKHGSEKQWAEFSFPT